MSQISGFSKLSKNEKVSWLCEHFSKDAKLLADYYVDSDEQKVFDELSENTVSNFIIPFGISPNFLINGRSYAIPMVIEESSVVAAASKSAKLWSKLGGFKAQVLSETKVGHIHLTYEGFADDLNEFFHSSKESILKKISPITSNMEKRGGGVLDIQLLDKTSSLNDYFQLEFSFNTCDAMGANFINTVLESYAKEFLNLASVARYIDEDALEVNMCILSNYTPKCLVNVSLECDVEDLAIFTKEMNAETFAKKFKRAIDISKVDISRAVTHNKGIFNGIDAVVLATGNDFRAVEACGHAYASRFGTYRGLSDCSIKDGKFKFEMTLPLAIGTVGGLTSLHPLAKTSLEILQNPSARELMKVIASVGLAQNFGAVSSLVTTGIQKGHMKMHLLNILNQLGASEHQVVEAKKYFEDRIVSFQAVRDFLNIH